MPSRHNKKPNCVVINPSRENRTLSLLYFFFSFFLSFNKLSDINQVKFLSFLSLFMELGCSAFFLFARMDFISHRKENKKKKYNRTEAKGGGKVISNPSLLAFYRVLNVVMERVNSNNQLDCSCEKRKKKRRLNNLTNL